MVAKYVIVPGMVRFGGVSGSFGLVMDIWAGLRLARIRTMARPNSLDTQSKRTKKVRLGINIALASLNNTPVSLYNA